MTQSSSERLALVTGGARRLGRHLVEVLAGRGFHVVINSRHSDAEAQAVAVEIVERGGRASVLMADVSNAKAVGDMFAALDALPGQLEVVVNNVGNYNPQSLRALTPAQWDSTLATNLSGAFYCCQEALKRLRRGGQIINIGMAGLEVGVDTHGLDYFVSKEGLLRVTRALAKAYGSDGVRVNMISPGQLANSIDLPQDIADQIPLGRPGTLEDISQAMVYLLDAAYVTGVNIEVAGGYRL